ncbi:MAG TPA: glycosyltransferase [Chloroflexia bacterium]|nr:glycosyltransferase [Chloroflexia bacterium]
MSETFTLGQITGLLDLGHTVHIYALARPQADAPKHESVSRYNLLARTTYIDMPQESGYWEMPVWPLTGRTWLPISKDPISNAARVLRALPSLARSFAHSPRLTFQVLNPSEYGYQARSLSALYRLAALCSRRGRYDVLHAHFGPVANSFRFARKLWKAPLVVSFHGYDFSVWPRKQGRGVYKRLFRDADAITVNSDFSRKRLEALGCPPARLHNLPMGVNLDEFRFRERRLEPGEAVRLLTVGRLVEKKGIEFSLRAVAEVRAKLPDVPLCYDIVGDGPLRANLQALIRAYGLQDRVTLHGARSHAYVQQMMEEAHIFVLASVTTSDGDQEGQGLVLQEAQASGLPVLATDHNGFRESLVPGQSGLLVPERDLSGLAASLEHLITYPERWPQMGMRGRRHVEEKYDACRLNRELAHLYAQVAKRYRSRRKGN